MRRILYYIITIALISLNVAALFAQKQKTQIAIAIEDGEKYLQEQDYKASRKAFKKALKIYDKSIEALHGFGQLEMAEENWEAAEDKFKAIIKLSPDDLTAHYYRAICLREDGRGKARFLQMAPGLNRLLEWNKSEKEFRWIIEQDSLFKDVFYQFALLESYRQHHEEAIELAHHQLRIHPGQQSTSVGILRLYRLLIRHKNNDETEKWLLANKDRDEACFTLAEKKRRNGHFEDAQKILFDLLNRSHSMSPIPAYFSLALINQQLGKPYAAQEFYWRSVNNIKSKIDAQSHFERIKYIFTENELQQFTACSGPKEYTTLIKQIWLQRDPTPAAQLNVRLMEHLRRYTVAERDFEYMGVRNQSNNPDKLHRLRFPAPYKLNQEFNDKGFIFIRHGQPDDRVRTLGESSIANESWRYFQRGERPQLTFHFIVDKTALPDNWRLAPLLEDRAMLEDRIDWGSYYHRMLTAPQVEQLSIESELVDESKISVNEAFTTDRHTWKEKLKPLILQYSVTTFRDKEDRTAVEIFYRTPLKQLQDEANGRDLLKLDQGISIHNTAWHEVKKDLLYSDITIPDHPVDPRIMVINVFRYSLAPDTLHFSLYAKVEQTPLLGAFKFDKAIPDYSTPGLHMSDIHLAYAVNPAKNKKFTRRDVDIMVNPSGYFSHLRPFHTYFEVYNLELDEQNKSRFEVTHTLKMVKSDKSVFGRFFSIFGVGKKSSISLTNMREGDADEAEEHIALDTKSLDTGQYTLTIKIQDLNSGETVSKMKHIVLY